MKKSPLYEIDWKNFEKKIKDSYSREYKILQSNLLLNPLGGRMGG